MEIFPLNYPALALSLVQVMLGVAVLILAKLAAGVLSPYAMDRELTSRDNPAFGLAICGYYAAAVMIYLGAAGAAPLPLQEGASVVFAAMGRDLIWSMAGIAGLNGSRWLMDRLLVNGVRNAHEITESRNLAAGALECGAYVAAGVILAGAIRQPGGTPWTAAALFLLGQCALIAMGRVYQSQRWSGYDVAAEIRSGNFAAGIAFALTLVALSLLMLKAISGEFTSWATSLSFFAFDAVTGMLLLMFLRWLTDAALLPGARITEEIVRDRNVNAGLIEGVLAAGIAAIILFVF
jgi:uncharacterized membrane protein YjfL (UPF0719 family)